MAVRGDLADVRLAEQVFAPHYAAAVLVTIGHEVPLRSSTTSNAEILATLAAGSPFEVLDYSGGSAWGIAAGSGLVGYIDRAAITTDKTDK